MAKLVVTPGLLACNARLQFLLYTTTFVGYRAHMTIAYINEDAGMRDCVVEELNGVLRGRPLPAKGLDIGD